MRLGRITGLVALTVLGCALTASPVDGSAPPTDPGTDSSTPTTLPETDAPESGITDFAVQPSGPDGPGGRDYFVYTLKPGASFGDVVAISNLSDTTQTYVVYPTDAFNTLNDAGFALLREDEEPEGVGTWIRLAADQYTLEPGERVDVPFEISVPADAAPGDHAGAIVAQPIDSGPADPDPSLGLDVRLRIAARVYVRVEGPITANLTIDSLSMQYDSPISPFGSSEAKIQYTITNTGNIRLTSIANLKVSGLFGIGETSLPERVIPELLPGSSIQIAETVQGLRPLGRLTADLVVESPNDAVRTSSSVSVWAMPWLLVIAIGLLVAALIVWAIRRRRRRRRIASAGPE